MTLVLALSIGLLGGLGAIGRFLLDGAVADLSGRAFPYGTLAVNITGAFALGVLSAAAVSGDTQRLIGTGLVGGYTTFSTWALESHRLGEAGQLRLAVLNVAVSLALGLGAAWLGQQLGTAL